MSRRKQIQARLSSAERQLAALGLTDDDWQKPFLRTGGLLHKALEVVRGEIETLRRETAEPPVSVIPNSDPIGTFFVRLGDSTWAEGLKSRHEADGLANVLRDKWRKGEV